MADSSDSVPEPVPEPVPTPVNAPHTEPLSEPIPEAEHDVTNSSAVEEHNVSNVQSKSIMFLMFPSLERKRLLSPSLNERKMAPGRLLLLVNRSLLGMPSPISGVWTNDTVLFKRVELT